MKAVPAYCKISTQHYRDGCSQRQWSGVRGLECVELYNVRKTGIFVMMLQTLKLQDRYADVASVRQTANLRFLGCGCHQRASDRKLKL